MDVIDGFSPPAEHQPGAEKLGIVKMVEIGVRLLRRAAETAGGRQDAAKPACGQPDPDKADPVFILPLIIGAEYGDAAAHRPEGFGLLVINPDVVMPVDARHNADVRQWQCLFPLSVRQVPSGTPE